MTRPIDIDDSLWDEVMFINGYAVFMGYLLMGVRGLALLVVTWSTAVLLGGYVDALGRKDFFSLTFITLIQSARVFDFLLTETLRDVINSGWGLLAAIGSMIIDSSKREEKPSNARWTLTYGVFAVQLLVFAFLLCPLVIIYTLGLFISPGISLWRLIDHNFGMIKEGSNLKPALEFLYSLALAQGILFGYRFIYDYGAKSKIAKEVSHWYQLDEEIVLEYLKETERECEKDPSFARGRNLVTYAADLTMKPNSRKSYLSGVLILGALLQPKYRWSGQPGLIKQLLTGSASFSHVVQRLLETFGPTSPYSSEIREKAARIVALVAGSIRLEHFPRGAIHCISSLLDTFDEYTWRPEGYKRQSDIPMECDRDWLFDEYDHDYLKIDGLPRTKAAESESPESDSHRLLHGHKGLVVVGLRILQKLAVDADNCKVISSTEGLVSKTMAHLISDQLHSDHHDEWCGIAAESLKLMSRLMASPGETGTELRYQISSNKEAVISISESVMECPKCEVLLKRQTIQVLLDMSEDTSSIVASGSRKVIFSWILLHIFLLPDHCFRETCGSTHLAKKGSYIRKLAGERLQSVLSLQSEGSATSILQSLGAVAGDLISRTIVDAIDNRPKLHAVDILVDLCHHYTEQDEFLEGLKNGVADVLPKVLEEILGFQSTSVKIQVVTESNNDQVLAPGGDIEKGSVSQGKGQENSSFEQQNGYEQLEGSKLQEALISLCMVIIKNWIDKNEVLTRRFDEITRRICSEQGMPVKTFTELVKEGHGKLMEKKKA